MVRTGTGVAVLIAFASYSSFAQEAKEDAERIQGKWKVIAGVYNGKPLAKKDPLIWTVTRSHFVYGNDSQHAYKLNPAKKPKQIDLTVVRSKAGDKVDRVVLGGIYELKGDMLRICVGYRDRPKDFKAGVGRNLFTLKRLKTE
jgi:uncharacterized protein (TIGR03067 family)